MKDIVNIGLAGFGTVGGATYEVLKRNARDLTRRTGVAMRVTRVVCRNQQKARARLNGDDVQLSSDWHDLVDDPSLDVVVEVMGGIEPAKSLVMAAIKAGKHVVTANKAMLATYGNEIFSAADAKGVTVAFEASVAGGIPIIKALREGLSANRIEWIAGIINGTSNFILSTMRDTGASFDACLAKAQELGYAEADPTFDIEGQDAAHKITILSALAFGTPVNYGAAMIEGISKLEAVDIRYAEELGYRIKLLGITKRTSEGVELRVHPALVPMRRLMASVEGVMNAVVVKGDAVGTVMLHGRGAGGEPTASAVIADLCDVSRMLANGNSPVPIFGEHDQEVGWLPIEKTVSSYYLRIGVKDEPGVLADVSRVFADNAISVESMMQKEAPVGASGTEIVIMTHSTTEGAIRRAVRTIEALESVTSRVVLLRKEELN
ncbi:MAG: homoserine dehydrogenase [Duodenibacillus sp.]|nr:homoserine dehydrogenase [Duodenibacillus sp.]